MATWTADAIIQLIFIILYAIFLVFNVFNVIKHGAKKQAGYISLVVVSLLKIVGNILLVVYETGASSNVSVYIWGLIVSQLGLLGLLYAAVSFIRKWILIYEHDDPSLSRYFQPIRLLDFVIMAGLICAIISGVWTSPDSSNLQSGYNLRRAADIIFLFCIIIIFVLAVFLMSKSRTREQKYNLVLLQDIIVMPILFLRIIYATVQAFLNNPTNPGHNTWVYLGLLLIPDFIALVIFTVCGFMTDRAPPAMGSRLANSRKIELGMTPQGAGAQSSTFPDQSATYQDYPVGTSQPAYPQPPRGRRQRRIRGPIHMLIDAFRGE